MYAIQADLRQVNFALSALERAPLQPLMLDLAKQLHTSVLLNFTQQRAPDGAPWLPSRAALAENRKTLIDTGRLLSSIDFTAQHDTAIVGTPVEYGERMHFGGGVGFGSAMFEGRPFLGIRDEDEGKLLQTVADYFEGIWQ